MIVEAKMGGYAVHDGNQSFVVYKDKKCTCKQNGCAHIDAVKRYLKNGGRPADPYPTFETKLSDYQSLAVLGTKYTSSPRQHPNHDKPIAERAQIIMAKWLEWKVCNRDDSEINQCLREAKSAHAQLQKESWCKRWSLQGCGVVENVVQEKMDL